MIYLLFGPESFLIEERVRSLRSAHIFVNPDFNTEDVEASQLSLSDIQMRVTAQPFLDDRRFMVVRGLLAGKKAPTQEQFKAFAESVPDFADVVLVEETLDRRTSLSKTVLQQTKAQEFALLKPQDMPGWVRDRCQQRQGQITPEAVNLLVTCCSNHLRTLDQEIQKLLSYANGQSVSVEMVREITPRTYDEDIFAMVDAIGARRLDTALRLLQNNLDAGVHALGMLTMIVRQFRLLLLARDFIDQSKNQADFARDAGIHPFVASKVFQQARPFKMAELKTIYNNLAHLDRDIKYGMVEPETGLQLFIASI